MRDQLTGFAQDNQVIATCVKSENIHSAYFLEMQTTIQDRISKPSMYLPIEIQVPDMVLKPVETPLDWKPMILSPVYLIFTSKLKIKEVLPCYDSKMDPTRTGMYGIWR